MFDVNILGQQSASFVLHTLYIIIYTVCVCSIRLILYSKHAF